MKANPSHTNISKIKAYINGSLLPEEMKLMEQDPFVMMALEGYKESENSIDGYHNLERHWRQSLDSSFNIFDYWKLGLGLLGISMLTFFLMTLGENTQKRSIGTTAEKNVIPSKEKKLFLEKSKPNVVKKGSTVVLEKKVKETPRQQPVLNEDTTLVKVEEASVNETVEKENIRPDLELPKTAIIINTQRYIKTTKEYLLNTYLSGVSSRQSKTKKGQKRLKRFSFALKENDLKKAVDLMEQSVEYKVHVNKYLPDWVDVITLLETKNYTQANEKIDKIPFLPPDIKQLKNELSKDLIMLMEKQ